jgi:hypothetical protein
MRPIYQLHSLASSCNNKWYDIVRVNIRNVYLTIKFHTELHVSNYSVVTAFVYVGQVLPYVGVQRAGLGHLNQDQDPLLRASHAKYL